MRRLMPTVGCEADAIAFTEEEGSSGSSGSSSSGASVDAAGSSSGQAMLFAADGSYNSGADACWPWGCWCALTCAVMNATHQRQPRVSASANDHLSTKFV